MNQNLQSTQSSVPVAYGTWSTIERGGGSISISSMGACFAMVNGVFYIFDNSKGDPPFVNGMLTREPMRMITPDNISGFECRKLNEKIAKFRFYCMWQGGNYYYQVKFRYKGKFGLAKRNPYQAEAVAAIVSAFQS